MYTYAIHKHQLNSEVTLEPEQMMLTQTKNSSTGIKIIKCEQFIHFTSLNISMYLYNFLHKPLKSSVLKHAKYFYVILDVIICNLD